MFDSNAMNEARHLSADRYQRAGGGGSHRVFTSSRAFDTARGYDEMTAFEQATYRARMLFKVAADLAKAELAYAPIALALELDAKRDAARMALANIPF